MRLVLCGSCERHVRDDGDRCPFCHAEIAVAASSADRVGRLGRAAIMAFGVAAGSAGIDGCQKDIAQPYGAPPERTEPTTIAMPYGAPPERPDVGAPLAPTEPDASANAVVDAAKPAIDASAKPKDAGVQTAVPIPTRNIAKPYGAPPDPDALV